MHYSVWVSHWDGIILDEFLINLWLAGYNAEKASQNFIEHEKASRRLMGLTTDEIKYLILKDTQEQFRTFDILEHYLKYPKQLLTQPKIPLPTAVRNELLERFYTIDNDFAREVLGRSQGKLAKNLYVISEKLNLELRKCVRQLQNLKRIYKFVESHKHSKTPIVDLVKKQFLISQELSSKYVRIIFLLFHRFESKKKLPFLSYEDFDYFVSALIKAWPNMLPVPYHLPIKFKEHLRDLKIHLLSQREHISIFKADVRNSLIQSKQNNIKLEKIISAAKSLLSLGASLSQPKHFCNFYYNISTIAIPLKKTALTKDDVSVIFKALTENMNNRLQKMQVRNFKDKAGAWTQFLQGVELCLLQMWDKVK
eukprot:TRINITY_DN5523_c0_g1_i1.p1 TRINITY_DN5523_c0_g1~~TRINITY_DN5523_c0_g1_i1.p1  ORF type:complete len:367 (-),score=29.92 TRINITY_DN5523_c0_g1_i1:60-1160(-)